MRNIQRLSLRQLASVVGLAILGHMSAALADPPQLQCNPRPSQPEVACYADRSSSTPVSALVSSAQQALQSLQRFYTPEGVKIEASRHLIKVQAQSFFNSLALRPGLTPDAFAQRVNQFVAACNVNNHNARHLENTRHRSLVDSIRQMGSIATANFRNAARRQTTYDTGSNPIAWQTPTENRTQYVNASLAAARELARIDTEIQAIVNDFDRPPASWAQNWPSWLPCSSVAHYFDYIRTRYAVSNPNRSCSRSALRGPGAEQVPVTDSSNPLDLRSRPEQINRLAPPMLASEAQLLNQFKIPVVDSSGNLSLDSRGQQIFTTVDLLQGQTNNLTTRCQLKETILRARMQQHAVLLARFPELGHRVDSAGARAANGTYVYNRVAQAAASGASETAQAQRVYNELGPASDHFLNQTQEEIRALCDNPIVEGEVALRNPAFVRSFWGCESSIGANSHFTSPDERSFAQAEARRCHELHQLEDLVCRVRQEAQRSGEREALALRAFAIGGHILDGAFCFTGAASIVGGIGRIGTRVLGEGARRALTGVAREGARSLANGTFVRQVAQGVFSPMNLAFVAASAGQISHEQEQARRDLANINAGLSPADLRASAEQAVRGNWGGFIRGIAQMSVIGHLLTSGSRIQGVRSGDIFSPEVTRAIAQSERAGNGASLSEGLLTQARNQLKAFLGGEVADPIVRDAINQMSAPELLRFARERLRAIEAGHAPDPRVLADGDLPGRFELARGRLQQIGEPELVVILDRIASSLTAARRQAIQEAHLSPALIRKARILRDAGFTPAERDALRLGGVIESQAPTNAQTVRAPTVTINSLQNRNVPVEIRPASVSGLTPAQTRGANSISREPGQVIPEILNLRDGQPIPPAILSRYSPQSIGENIVYRRMLQEEASGHGRSNQNYDYDFWNNTEIQLYFPSRVIDQIAEHGFLNIFQVDRVLNGESVVTTPRPNQPLPSHSGSSRSHRVRAESVLSGLDLNDLNSGDAQVQLNRIRPISTALDLTDNTRRGQFGYIHSSITGYGDVVAVLNDRVRRRTTWTAGDSSNLVNHPSPGRSTEGSDPIGRTLNYRSPQRANAYGYFEAQIWGGVSRNDIREFLVSPNISPENLAKLRRFGVPIYEYIEAGGTTTTIVWPDDGSAPHRVVAPNVPGEPMHFRRTRGRLLYPGHDTQSRFPAEIQLLTPSEARPNTEVHGR
jgi:hypothetical protein